MVELVNKLHAIPNHRVNGPSILVGGSNGQQRSSDRGGNLSIWNRNHNWGRIPAFSSAGCQPVVESSRIVCGSKCRNKVRISGEIVLDAKGRAALTTFVDTGGEP